MPVNVIDPNIKKLMQRFSLPVKWYGGRLCSCVGENNGVPKENHICNLGFYYSPAVTTYVIRNQVSYKYTNTPHGRIFEGGATFIIPKYYNGIEQQAYTLISYGDIISINNKLKRDTDILLRGVRDKIYAFNVDRIISVYSGNTQYIEGVDFNKGEEASIAGNLTTINWISGKGPDENEYYTVEFAANQQFKVWEDAGNDRGTESDFLPKKIVCVMRRFVRDDQILISEIETKQKFW